MAQTSKQHADVACTGVLVHTVGAGVLPWMVPVSKAVRSGMRMQLAHLEAVGQVPHARTVAVRVGDHHHLARGTGRAAVSVTVRQRQGALKVHDTGRGTPLPCCRAAFAPRSCNPCHTLPCADLVPQAHEALRKLVDVILHSTKVRVEEVCRACTSCCLRYVDDVARLHVCASTRRWTPQNFAVLFPSARCTQRQVKIALTADHKNAVLGSELRHSARRCLRSVACVCFRRPWARCLLSRFPNCRLLAIA